MASEIMCCRLVKLCLVLSSGRSGREKYYIDSTILPFTSRSQWVRSSEIGLMLMLNVKASNTFSSMLSCVFMNPLIQFVQYLTMKIHIFQLTSSYFLSMVCCFFQNIRILNA